MSSPPVPNLPPISAIADPAVRAYLEVLTNAWAVRNGQVGDGGEKFLTLKDLEDGVRRATSGDTGQLGLTGRRNAGGAIASLLQRLSDDIQASRIWKKIGDRIDKIEIPEWFAGRFGAEIKTEQVRVNEVTSALALQTTTAVSRINGNVGLIQAELQTTSDSVSATASDVTTLQVALFGSNDADLIAEQVTKVTAGVDGVINGTYSLKFDAQGYVTGFGLGLDQTLGGDPSSAFYVRADRFAIGPPSTEIAPDVNGSLDPAATAIPFTVLSVPTQLGATLFPPGVYMNAPLFGVSGSFSGDLEACNGTFSGDLLACNGTFSGTMTADAVNAVDTINLRGNAITVPMAYDGLDVYHDFENSKGIIFFTCSAHAVNDASVYFYLYINEVLSMYQACVVRADNGTRADYILPVVLIHSTPTALGIARLRVAFTVTGGSLQAISSPRFVAMTTKR